MPLSIITIFGLIMGIFFPAEARLDFNQNIPQEELVLSFNPEIDINTLSEMETGLERKYLVEEAVFFTSYNPVVGQTDNSPCIGASGKDQCELAKQGVRMIALSQDLVGRLGNKPFVYGDTAILEQRTNPAIEFDSRCNGEFMVVDTMNKRFIERGDIFFMDRQDNTSCYVDLYIKQ